MNKILLIGNKGLKYHGEDGQTLKVRLYEKKLKDEGFEVIFVELEDFTKKPISKLFEIRRGIKECNRIVLISAKRGCRILIPFINRVNKRFNKPFILPLIGTSVLHYSVDKLDDENKIKFFKTGDLSLCRPNKRIANHLKKITYILPETEQLCDIYKKFYSLKNVYCLTNFRETNRNRLSNNDSNIIGIKIVFLSRVMKEKGILDLINCLKLLDSKNYSLICDVYGKIFLDEESKNIFETAIDEGVINYCGIVKSSEAINVLSNYDLFVFPTRFVGEGVPGVIVESLLAGVPVLSSNFPQSSLILKEGFDSLFYEMFNVQDMKDKIMYIIKNKDILQRLQKGCIETGKKYSYSYERNKFLKYICGIEEGK